jgi:hypothetical protein
MYSIVEVCPPGGEWLEVVDDPKVGSVWQCRRHHDDWYAVVRSVDEQWVTYDSLGREAVDQKCDVSKWHDRWELVDSSRIVEGMDGGRRRRFVKAEVRILRSGEDVWYEESSGKVCKWGVDCASYKPLQVLLPLNFIDPAPSITPATVKESLQVDHQSKKYIDDLLHRLGSVGEPGAYRDMVREAKAVIESLTMKVDPLSWDANPPMVGDFVQDKDGHRMMITTQYSDGKVVVGEYDSDPIELSRDELKQKGYVRLILSPLHKEDGR